MFFHPYFLIDFSSLHFVTKTSITFLHYCALTGEFHVSQYCLDLRSSVFALVVMAVLIK